MTVIFENTLGGANGVRPTNALLSASGDPVTIQAPTRSAYSSTRTIRGENSIRLTTGHHREDTTRLVVAGLNSRPYCLRWYVWFPEIPTGNGERRWLGRIRNFGLVAHQTAYGNIYLQLSPLDLSAAEITPEVSGSSALTGQWLRIEAQCTTAYLLDVRVYTGHNTSGFRLFRFTDAHVNGGEFHISSFRYRRRTLVQWGSSGSAVREAQTELIALGFLPSGSNDGAYGDQTFNAIVAFQTARGLPADGAVGNETWSAFDVARGRTYPETYISHFAATNGPWVGPVPEPPPPIPDPDPFPFSIGMSV